MARRRPSTGALFTVTSLVEPSMPPWARIAASFYNGATIPYILKAPRIYRGSGDDLTAAECKTELRRLLSDICDGEEPPSRALLKICPTLDAVIVGVWNRPRLLSYSAPAPMGFNYIGSTNPRGRGISMR